MSTRHRPNVDYQGGYPKLYGQAARKARSWRNPIRSAAKGTIVTLALHGLLPYRLAGWLIQRGGLRDA